MMVKFIAQDVLGWSLFLEICFHSTFLGVTNPFLHRFTQQPCNDTQISRLPTGGRIHGNNRQLLSREGLVEVNMGQGFWLKIFDLGFLWKKQILDNLWKVDGS